MLRKVEEILAKVEAVDSYQTIGGYGAVTSTYQPNFGSIFVRLKPWEERHEEALHVKGIMARVNRELVQIPEAVAFPFNIPTISGFGAAAGFNFLLQDRSGSLTVDQLGAQTRAFLAAARQRRQLRAGSRRARRGLPEDDASGDRLRLLVAVLSGEDRSTVRADVHPGHRVRLPAAGRDVRELAPALGRAARLAARRPRRLLRRVALRLRQQRLRSDRPDHARRARAEARNPDRRDRQGQARTGPGGRGGRAGVGPAALPAYLDDSVRLHSRRRAADAGQRSGSGRPERDGHCRVLGNADRHRARCLPHPRELRVRGGAGQEALGDEASRDRARRAPARAGS